MSAETKTLKRLFLIDGFGAIISAVLLGIVLVKFERYFGIPRTILYLLATFPCLFAIYDFYCYFRIKKNLAHFLKRIAIINLLYCSLSLGLAFYHFNEITTLGWMYLVIEIIIIICLSQYELKVAKNHKN